MKQENIILLMVSFFITEMLDSGISTDDEIKNYFNQSNEKAFKKMLHEYKRMQSLTRSKAISKVIELKKEIADLKSNIKISK